MAVDARMGAFPETEMGIWAPIAAGKLNVQQLAEPSGPSLAGGVGLDHRVKFGPAGLVLPERFVVLKAAVPWIKPICRAAMVGTMAMRLTSVD